MKIRDRLNQDRLVITEAYLSGESTCSLGRRYDCSNASVFLALRDWGVLIRQTKSVGPNSDKIIELHKQGLTAYQITKQLKLPKNCAERALKKAGYNIRFRQKKREDPLFNHTEEIVSRYKAGDGVHIIAKDFDCQDASIIRFLRKRGITLRSLRYYAYPVNEHFFNVIDTEGKAYTLGLLMADGTNDQRRGVIRLGITDEGLCRAVARELQFEGMIAIKPPRKKRRKTQYIFAIGSRIMSDALGCCGCVSRKTYVAKIPSLDIVSSDLRRHLIRGWLDGDGTITQDSKTERWFSRIVGTEAVCRGLSNCIYEPLGFLGSVCPVHVGEKHTTWGFAIGGRCQLESYLDWLYRDASIFLRRKFDKYLAFCKQYGLTPVTTVGRGV